MIEESIPLILTQYQELCFGICENILRALGIDEEQEYFSDGNVRGSTGLIPSITTNINPAHEITEDNTTPIRFLHTLDTGPASAGCQSHIACDSHTDTGTSTLLFHYFPGLQALAYSDQWISVTRICLPLHATLILSSKAANIDVLVPLQRLPWKCHLLVISRLAASTGNRRMLRLPAY